MRQIISQVFYEKAYNFNLKLLWAILLMQYLPFLFLIFTNVEHSDTYLMRYIFIAAQSLVVLFVGYVEIIQLMNNGFAKQFLSWENINDQIFLWLNFAQVILKLIYISKG